MVGRSLHDLGGVECPAKVPARHADYNRRMPDLVLSDTERVRIIWYGQRLLWLEHEDSPAHPRARTYDIKLPFVHSIGDIIALTGHSTCSCAPDSGLEGPF